MILPYMIWSAVYAVLNVVVNPDMFSAIFLLKQFAKIFVGKAAPQLYFVFVLIQLKLMTPCYLKYQSNKIFVVLLSVSSLIWIALYNANKIFNLGIPDYFSACFLSWQVYYFLGIKLKRKNIDHLRLLSILVAFLGLIDLGESFVIKWLGLSEAAYQVAQLRFVNVAFATFASVLLITIAKKTRDDRTNKIYLLGVKIGDISYPIYYIHYIPIIICNYYIFKSVDVYSFPLPVVQLVEGIFVLCITALLGIVLTKVLGPKKYLIGL